MDRILKSTPREELKKLLKLNDDDNLLIVKTLNNLPIILKYVAKRTSLGNVVRCLRDKVQYNLQFSNNNLEMDKIDLKYNNIILDNQKEKLDKYGINKSVETLNMCIKQTRKINYQYNITESVETVFKQIETSFEKRILEYGSIQIFIKTLSGKTITFTCPKDVTIEEIKYMFMEREGVPLGQNRLVYQGREMRIEDKFSDHAEIVKGNNQEYTVHSILRLRGGMYHEVSGRNGEYKNLDSVLDRIYIVDADFS